MIEKALGEDWRDKYVVWDNCCGTKNLTRDYHFGELYSSTLEQSELEISKRYNQEGVAFRFDFLNDDLSMLPQGLMEALRTDKPIVFFLNPPYTGIGSGVSKVKEKGTIKSFINERMLADNIGKASQNLYAQFLYRIELIQVSQVDRCPTLRRSLMCGF